MPDDIFQRGSSNCFLAFNSARHSLSPALVSIADEHSSREGNNARQRVCVPASTQKFPG